MKFAGPAIAMAMLIAAAAPAAAGACEEGLRKLETALADLDITPDVKTQVQDMRAQAEQLCDAGNEEEGADILSEVIALLGIE